MQKIMQEIFKFLKDFFTFMKILLIFIIIMLLFYWIQVLLNSTWSWMDFIRPFLAGLVDFAGIFTSASFNLFAAVFEVKYFIALVILFVGAVFFDFLSKATDEVKRVYNNSCIEANKRAEERLNRKLEKEAAKEQHKLNKYSVLIYTKIKEKFKNALIEIDINEQNSLMNKFITEKTGESYMMFNGGFIYNFNNFNEIDNVLEVLFKVINSEAPLDYAISIQLETGKNDADMAQLVKLGELKRWGQISTAVDTVYRYGYNQEAKYFTDQVGIFNTSRGTLEVHEFREFSVV